MADSSILLADEFRLATEEKSRSVGNATHQEHYQKVAELKVGAVPLPLRSYLQDSQPSIEMAVDGSVTPVDFELAPADGEVWRIERIVLLMVLAAAPEMTQFGTLAELTNGLLLETRDASAQVTDLLGGQPAKSNNDLATVASVDIVSASASHTLKAEIRPTVPLRLDGAASELLQARVQDNLSTLTRFRAFVDGLKEETLT